MGLLRIFCPGVQTLSHHLQSGKNGRQAGILQMRFERHNELHNIDRSVTNL